ncbi:MAG: 4-hydroxy-tetrahydrodipicolinate synthase [Steroidobacteraceae bacterium]|jgi:4-hydroxy-tetrahydrodipicolinate synthase
MFSGSLVAIVTPMDASGALDFDAWDRLLDLHVRAGTSGIIVGGTTGESTALAERELLELLRRARTRLRGRASLIAGLGGSHTASVCERARVLSAESIDGLLVVTPAYNRPTQEGLFQHFAAIAEAAARPILLYNVPSRTAVDLLPATIGRLAKLPRIVGVKEAVPSVARVVEVIRAAAEGFIVLSGDDQTARESILAGARGVISVTANVAPEAMALMTAAALRGERATAEHIDASLAGLHRELFIEANPIPVKWALEQMGLIAGGIRLPLTRMSEAAQAPVSAALHTALAAHSPAQVKSA